MSDHRQASRIRVGKVILANLRACGMSQGKLAREVGVSTMFMCDLVHGRRSTNKLEKIEDALALPRGTLLAAAGICRHCAGSGYEP